MCLHASGGDAALLPDQEAEGALVDPAQVGDRVVVFSPRAEPRRRDLPLVLMAA